MYNLTALCTISQHWGLEGGGDGPETSHAHKITYGPLIDMALYVMCLMGANPLLGPLKGLGHESQDFLGRINERSIGNFMYMSSQELPWPITGWGGGKWGKIVHTAVRLYTVQ